MTDSQSDYDQFIKNLQKYVKYDQTIRELTKRKKVYQRMVLDYYSKNTRAPQKLQLGDKYTVNYCRRTTNSGLSQKLVTRGLIKWAEERELGNSEKLSKEILSIILSLREKKTTTSLSISVANQITTDDDGDEGDE